MYDVRASGLDWTTTDGSNFYRELPIHLCNDADRANFYAPNPNFAGEIDGLFNKLYCFDNLADLKMYGNFNTDNCQTVEVRIIGCKLSPKQC